MNARQKWQQVIKERLSDYDEAKNLIASRNGLVAAWRAAHPEAVNQPASDAVRPLMPMTDWRQTHPEDPEEVWHNDVYNVTVRRHVPDRVFGTGSLVHLGIATLDGTARHDWRDMQAIKNQLVGPEVEAFELYPAESRLMDPSNYYILWCFPALKRIRVGSNDPRRVFDSETALAPQRGLPEGTPITRIEEEE